MIQPVVQPAVSRRPSINVDKDLNINFKHMQFAVDSYQCRKLAND